MLVGLFLLLCTMMVLTSSLRWHGVDRRVLSTIRTMATKGEVVVGFGQQVGQTATFKMRHPGTCTGMYWRRDPRQGKNTFSGPPDWPRNQALLKGVVHEFQEKPEGSVFWLEVSEYCQAGSTQWEKTPGAWMQFDQGGLLLHP